MPLSFSMLVLVATFTLSLFIGMLNIWFWHAERAERTPLLMAIWLTSSSIFAMCRILQYTDLSDDLHRFIPRVLLTVVFLLPWIAYELGNAFINYTPRRWERVLFLGIVFTAQAILWSSDLILTRELIVRTLIFGGEFTDVHTGPLYIVFIAPVILGGLIPILRLFRTDRAPRAETRLMAAGVAFVILFGLNDFAITDFNLIWIRLSDFGYLPVAIIFSYIQVNRLGRLYQSMEDVVEERTVELRQANIALQGEIDERIRAERDALHRAEMVTALYDTTRDLIFEHDLSTLLNAITIQATKLLDSEGGGLYLCEPENNLVRCVVSYKTPRDYTGTTLNYGEGSAGRVAQTGEPLIIEDYGSWAGKSLIYADTTPFHSVLSVPIIWKEELIGVLQMLNYKERRKFTEDDIQVIASFANQAAIAVQNTRLYNQVEQELAERKRAEVLLQQSRTQLAGIIETALDGIITVDEDQKILIFNAAAEKIFHCKAADAIGQPVDHFILVSICDLIQEQNVQGELIDLTGRRLNGEEFPMEASISQIEVENQIFYTVIHRDITERKQSQQALKASEERYRLLFESNPHPMWVYDVETLAFLVVNDAAVAHYGYTQEEFLGMTLKDIRPASELPALQENLAKERQNLEWSGPWKHLKKDGSIILVEILSHHLFLNDKTARLVLANDITERKKAEDALRASENKFSMAFRTSPDSISINRVSDGRYIEVNDGFCRLTGYAAEEVLGKTTHEIDIWAEPQDRDQLTKKLNEQGEVSNLEALVSLKDGQTRPGLVSARVVEVDGEACILSITRDITSLKQAAEEVRRRADEMAALAEVSRVISSTLDLDLVLERVAFYARDLLQAETSAVYLFDPAQSTFKAIAAIGLDAEEIKQEPLKLGEGILGNIALFHVGEIVNDTASDPRAIIVSGTERESNEHLMGVSVWADDNLTGLIAVWRSGMNNEFIHAELAFLSNLAHHVAVAVENARLFESTVRRYTEIEAVHTVSTSLRAARSLEEALPIILEKLTGVMKAEAGLVDLADPATGEIVTLLASGDWAHITGMHTPPGSGVSGSVMASRQPYITSDVVADGLVYRPDLIGGQYAAACVPITATHQPIGALWIGRKNSIQEDEIRLLSAIGDMVGSALQRMILHEQTEYRANKLASLRAIDQAITANVELDIILNIVLNQVRKHLQVHAADILLFSSASRKLTFKAALGFKAEILARVELQTDQNLGQRVVTAMNTVHLPDLAHSENPSSAPDFLLEDGFRAYYGAPLIVNDQLIGVLECFQRAPYNVDDEWIGFLEALAGQAAIAIEKARILEDLQSANLELTQAYEATLAGWAKALELRDKETEGHSRRVSDLTLVLARELGINDAEMIHVHRGVLLHDIGKMGIPDQILKKTGPLNDDEWEEMRRHPEYAYNLLHPIAYLRPALDIPYCHHERWDGSGYPRGLKGEEIPLAARIFAVVDVWDALINDRPYREAWSEETALDYIQTQSEVQFDPRVVEKFMKLVRSKSF